MRQESLFDEVVEVLPPRFFLYFWSRMYPLSAENLEVALVRARQECGRRKVYVWLYERCDEKRLELCYTLIPEERGVRVCPMTKELKKEKA